MSDSVNVNEARGDENGQQRGEHAAAAAAVSAEGAQVVNPGPDDIVTLPAGTNIVSVEADGRDLLIILDDGEKILVPGGAVVVPEIVVDGTVVPPTNIAALLIDSEVQPAAGPPASSGGNFAADEGAIQAAYDLGNLLPYTELQFDAQPRQEIIPGLVDRELGVVVETPDNPVGAINAIATVYEAGLPARNGEPAGTGEAADGNGANDSDTRETTSGTIVFDAPDGTQAVLINGVAVDHVGQTFTSAMGTMTITSIDIPGGHIGFSYTLNDNLLGQATDGFFQMTVVDSDGDQATASLTINVVDDAPIAADDTDTVAAANFGSESGNVISGAGTTSGAAGADRVGADNSVVSSVSHGATSVDASGGTMVIAGDYGTLTLHADGSYTYDRGANAAGGASDQFTYTLTDGDGSTDTATLTITIEDSPTTLRVPLAGEAGTEVHEAGLAGPPAGSAAAGDGEFTSGTIAYTAPDGPAVITINGTAVSAVGDTVAGAHGTLTITGFSNGSITYTYQLTTNTSGNDTSDSFAVVVTDADGDHSDGTLVVSIVDDVPTAHADVDSVTEDGPLVADGNVLTGAGGSDANTSDGVADVSGADGAHVTAVSFGATAGTVGTALAGAYGSLTLNADGSYSYTLDNANPLVQGLDQTEHLTETFTYTITDGDGDPSTTTLTITINGADDGVTIGGLDAAGAEQTVFENDLADGSSPDAAALTRTGTFTVTAQDGLATISVGGHVIYTGDAFVAGQTISTAYGTLTLTGVKPTTTDANGDVTAATVSYSYTLTDNTLTHTGADDVQLTDSFAITVTDTDGSTASDHLEVTVVDDTPTAVADVDSVTEDGALVADGNVLTGAGGSDVNTSDGVADVSGADGAHVTAVSFGATAGTVGTALAGAYGSLTLNADGSYSYTLDNANPLVQGLDQTEHLTETFTYTITDGDGDPSTTTLTITINGADDGVTIGGLDAAGAEQTVFENDLADGSSPDAAALTRTGTFTVTAQDGLATISVGGHVIYTGDAFVAGQTISTAYGTLTLTGVKPTTTDANGDVTAATVSYSYTLTDNTLTHTGADDVQLTDSFAITVTDTDGSTASDHLEVTVVDDTPTAVADVDSVTEDGALVADGNVLTGAGGSDVNTSDGVADVSGADGAHVTAVSFGATAGTVGTALAGAYGSLTLNADGSYSYTLDNANPLVQGLDQTEHLTETFTYTITDGDGDPSTTTLTITINGADDGVTIGGLDAAGAEQTVFENDLADGSSPDAAALTRTGTFTVTAQDGLATISVGGHVIYTGDAFVAGQTISTAYGTLTLTGVKPTTTDANGDVTAATVSYSYTLTDNTLTHTGADDVQLTDSFAITVTDTDGSTASDHLEVTVVDDTPTAVDDVASQAMENAAFTIDALGNDTFGADGVETADASKVFVSTQASQGVVTYDTATGLFTYTPNAGAGSSGTTDTFEYTIVDKDGDSSTATASVNLQPDSEPTGGLAMATVDDDGLAGGNVASTIGDIDANIGDNPADTSEKTFSGTLPFSVGNDGPATIGFNASLDGSTATIGLETVTYSVSGGILTATITGGARDGTDLFKVEILDSHTGDYKVTLLANVLNEGGPNEEALDAHASLGLTVTDSEGDHAPITLNITFNDDAPTAYNDGNAVDEGGSIGGNVLSDGAADAFGADGKGGVASFTDGVHTAVPGGTIETALGFLTINADGSYDYQSKSNSTATDTHDTFTYTIVDADGDTSTATLTIDITATKGNVSDTDVTVDESGLDNGTYHGSQLVPNGEFDTDGQITATGGTPPYTYVLTDPANGTYGTLTLNADGSYSYTLDTPFTDSVNENSRNVVNGAESFGYEVHDNLGNVIGTGTISVNIVDDVPNAVDDGTTHVAEDLVGTIGGNVLANDTQGADTAKVTSVNIGGVDHAVAAVGTTSVSTANGDYTFKADGTWTFDPHAGLNQSGGPVDASFTYTLTDGDGDHDTATKTILIDDGANPTGGDTLALTVDDGALPDGNNSASTAEVGSGALTFTAGSDALTTFAFGTDLSSLGGGLTWTRVDANTITGSDGATLVVTLKLTAPASIAAGASGDVTVTATLANNYDSHPLFTADDLQALGSVTVVASDQDGDSATGTVSVSVSDDVPTLSVSGDTAVVEGQTANGTWTESVGADSPGTTVVVFNGTEYALGSAINTGKGTLTVNANGTWSFASNNNLDNSVAQSITFTVKVTDVDHDVASDPQTIAITDGAGPTGGDTLTLIVDDEALPDGTNSASTAETDSGTLTFTAGSDALTSFAFGTDLSGLGAGLTWARVDANTITGSDGGTLVVTLKLTAPASIAAGGTGDVTVTATLANNYAMHPGLNVDDLQALGSVAVVASDHDGDSATGTVSVSVSDDLPLAVTADAVSVTNTASGNNFAYLDSDHTVANNYGADGPGAVIFTTATIAALQSQNLTSGLASLDYAITNGGTTLTATKSTDHSVVFTIDLQPAGHADQYQVHINQPLDSLQTVDFNDGGYDFVGGNGSWAGFTQPGDNDSQDLLLSPVGAGTVNTNANEGGVGSGNSVGSGEAMRVDYVVDLNGSPVSGGNFNGGDNTQTFDGHYTVNGGSAFFTHTSSSTIHIAAFDDNDSGTLKTVGDGAPDTINKIAISYNAGLTVITSNGTYSVGGHSFTVTFNGDGTANVAGVTDGTKIAAYTTDGYNSIEWGYASGGTFKIGDFGATVISNDPVHFTAPISIQDGDGDIVSSGDLSITANPVTPPIAFDLNGDGVDFLGLSAGVTHDYGHGTVATAWVAAEDGLLAHQTASGLDVVFTDDAAGAPTDLQGLQLAYDSNHDGQLTSADSAWSSFGVWQDANSDGVADAGEFKTLDQAGISAIRLSADGTSYTTADGDVTVAGTGSYTRTDGSSASFADALFATAAQKIGQQTIENAALGAALGGFIGVPTAQPVYAAPVSQPAVVSALDGLSSPAASVANDVEHTYKAVSAASVELTAPQPQAEPHTSASSGSHEADNSHQAMLPELGNDRGSTAQIPTEASPELASQPSQPAHGPSDVALMDALLTMQHPAQAAPTDQPATTQVADAGGTVTTQDLPNVAEVLHDALAGHVVDQIVDKFTGGNGAAMVAVADAQPDSHGAGAAAAGGAAAQASLALDVHLDAQTGGHAALFAAMPAMPMIEEHAVVVAA